MATKKTRVGKPHFLRIEFVPDEKNSHFRGVWEVLEETNKGGPGVRRPPQPREIYGVSSLYANCVSVPDDVSLAMKMVALAWPIIEAEARKILPPEETT